MSVVGVSVIGDDALEGVNSPCAMSSEVLPSSRTLGAEEDHAPGKNREDAVDSSLARGFGGVSKGVEVVSVPAFSSTGTKRELECLKKKLVRVDGNKWKPQRTYWRTFCGSSVAFTLVGNTWGLRSYTSDGGLSIGPALFGIDDRSLSRSRPW